MIGKYARLDTRAEGCFGYHPILDYSRTSYAKDICLLPLNIQQCVDPEVLTLLDVCARANLPVEVKNDISKLIEKHCLNCGVSMNFDVNTLNSMPDEMTLTFTKLWKHVFSISKMSQSLVLDVIKIMCELVGRDENCGITDGGHSTSPVHSGRVLSSACKDNFVLDNSDIHVSHHKHARSVIHRTNDGSLRAPDMYMLYALDDANLMASRSFKVQDEIMSFYRVLSISVRPEVEDFYQTVDCRLIGG